MAVAVVMVVAVLVVIEAVYSSGRRGPSGG